VHVTVVVPSYNGARRLPSVVRALRQQRLAAADRLDVVIVDDGSTDGSADIVASECGDAVTLVRLPRNQGRSSARNAGAAAAQPGTDVLLFIDVDCMPGNDDLVSRHLAGMAAGADVVFGQVTATGSAFWDHLQRSIGEERARRFDNGDQWAFTTANFSVRHATFMALGGFDEAFNRYGFEDRDLFVRLALAGACGRFEPDASVIHEDSLTLAGLCAKQQEAGRFGAALFRSRHPRAYRQLPASRLDGQLHPNLAIVDRIAYPIVKRVAQSPTHWLEWCWLPFRLRALLARVVYGLFYLHGTRLQDPS
jgi:GT2 family glycosyltransferase